MTIGDYVLTVRLDKRMSETIEQLFQSTENVDEPNRRRIVAALNGQARIKLQVENNSTKAAKVLAHFLEYFPTAGADL